MRWRPWVVAALAAAAVAAHAVRYPPSAVAWDPRLLAAPSADKVADVLAALGALLLVNLAAWSAAGPLHRVLRPAPDERARATIERLGLGLMILAHAVLALAALRLTAAPALIGLLAAALAVDLRALVRGIAGGLGAARRRPDLCAPAVGLGALLLLPALHAFGADHGWDALTYHLAIPERLLRSNAVEATPLSIFSAFPHAVEMLYALALALHGTALAHLLNLEFAVLALLVVARLAATAGRPRAGALAAVALLADPLFRRETEIVYTDLAFLLYALLALAAAAEWSERPSRRGIVRAGLLAGACATIRYPGAAVPLALGLALALPPWRNGARAHAGAALALAAVAATTLAPWLLRNALLTGNPVSPALQGLFHAPGREFFDPVVVAQNVAFTREVGMGRGPLALLALPWNLTMRSRPGLYSGSFGWQVGPLYLAALIAVSALPSVRRAPGIGLALRFTGLYTLLWFFGLQEARYLLPALAGIALAGGVALDRLTGDGRARSAALLGPSLAALTLAWGPDLPRLAGEYAVALGPLARERIEAADPAAAAARFLRATARPGERVLLLFEPRSWFFRGLDHVPYHSIEGSPILRTISRARDEHDLACRLAALSPTWIVVNRGLLDRFRPFFVAGYDRAAWARDLRRTEAYLRAHTAPVRFRDDVLVARALPVSGCPARR